VVTQRIANPCIPVRFWARPPISSFRAWVRKKLKNVIVVCATPNWLGPAAVTLLSCAQNGAAKVAELIIVCPNPSSRDENDLALFNKMHATQIRLLGVDPDDLAEIESGHLGVGALLRLKLDAFLPTNLERVLYLDSDVLAEGSLNELFEMPMNGFAFAAVESIAMLQLINAKANTHLKSLNISPARPYFNSGVILFDWQASLEARILPQCRDVLKSRQNWHFHDQDVLNIVSNGKWKQLLHKWNVTKKTADYLNIKPRLRHFNGKQKPWNSKARFGFSKYHMYYASSLANTPWANFAGMKQLAWPIRDNWRALVRQLSFTTIYKLKNHITRLESVLIETHPHSNAGP
jgi:lipopolysaccharide biosynthesis glycosyltransferase